MKACSLLEPYIEDIFEQMDAAIAIFAMEKNGKGTFPMPVLMPHRCIIENQIQLTTHCAAIENEVKSIYEELRKTERSQARKSTSVRRATSATQTVQTTTPVQTQATSNNNNCTNSNANTKKKSDNNQSFQSSHQMVEEICQCATDAETKVTHNNIVM